MHRGKLTGASKATGVNKNMKWFWIFDTKGHLVRLCEANSLQLYLTPCSKNKLDSSAPSC